MRFSHWMIVSLAAAAAATACGGDDDDDGHAVGGSAGSSGAQGSSGKAGRGSTSGGSAGAGKGGTSAAGGAGPSGGANAVGGSGATGGSSGAGGAQSAGGSTHTGGTGASGGTETSGTGGTDATGNAGSGGTDSTGDAGTTGQAGSDGTGQAGENGTGGTGTGGTGTGGEDGNAAGAGGAGATGCTNGDERTTPCMSGGGKRHATCVDGVWSEDDCVLDPIFLVTKNADGVALGGSQATLSADGRYVAFTSNNGGYVPGDTNLEQDVFVRDIVADTVERVSVASSGVQGDGRSKLPSISGDGRYVAFESTADNLVASDTNGASDVFVHDRTTGTTERVSVSSAGAEGTLESMAATISADGRYVAFLSRASNLAAGTFDGIDVYVRDRQTSTTSRVMANSSTNAALDEETPRISANGRFVVLTSWDSGLVGNDLNGNSDVFLRDLQLGTTGWISASLVTSGWGGGFKADVSSDGNRVAFESTNGYMEMGVEHGNVNIFVKNTSNGDLLRVTDGNRTSSSPSISDDGRFVAFLSLATDLVNGDTSDVYRDAFVQDTQTGANHRLSVSAEGDEGNDDVIDVTISGDGHFAAFSGGSNNLVPNDTNASFDVFVTPLD